MRVFTLCCGEQVTSGGAELLDAWQRDAQAWLWVDLTNEPEAAERALLVDRLKLDQHAVLEAQRPRHPPGFEVFSDYLYLLTKPLTSDSSDLDFETLQLALFAGPRLLVTRHSKPSRYISMQQQSLREQGCAQLSPMDLVARIARRITERYGKVLLGLEARLDEIEDQLFDAPGDRLLKELVGYNTQLRKMRRILAYHCDAFAALREYCDAAQSPHWQQEFDDIHGLMARFHSLSNLYQSVINDLVDGYISLNGHHLNQIMKVLTIVTVIFLPLALLVGIYGMNFENMPELKTSDGYFILLGVMGGIVSGLLLLFRRVRWL